MLLYTEPLLHNCSQGDAEAGTASSLPAALVDVFEFPLDHEVWLDRQLQGLSTAGNGSGKLRPAPETESFSSSIHADMACDNDLYSL